MKIDLNLVWWVARTHDKRIVKSKLQSAPVATRVELYGRELETGNLFSLCILRCVFCEKKLRWSLVKSVCPLWDVLLWIAKRIWKLNFGLTRVAHICYGELCRQQTNLIGSIVLNLYLTLELCNLDVFVNLDFHGFCLDYAFVSDVVNLSEDGVVIWRCAQTCLDDEFNQMLSLVVGVIP